MTILLQGFEQEAAGRATGSYSHAEGLGTLASGARAHAEGASTTASAQSTHAEGQSTTAGGNYAHAEGLNSSAPGAAAHAEGSASIASGNTSHAEGFTTTAGGDFAHAENYLTQASGVYSHAQGRESTASGDTAHAEGRSSVASGMYSNAGGYYGVADGINSWARGGLGGGTAAGAPIGPRAQVATYLCHVVNGAGSYSPLTFNGSASYTLTPPNTNVLALGPLSAYLWELKLVARKPATGNAQGWIYSGMIAREATGTARLIGSVTQLGTWADVAFGTVLITASSNMLLINVRGDAGFTYWNGVLTVNELQSKL